ncbi:MarR family winged helix-turn-helix transcriptional regulator [Paenochrobactrum pullorum]|uniref:MarR family winged helix-turn-helix transcriptional regulator n=1 Tax=Paenochrobactrum pullorum TaxID=1324351 RepID=UPI0035BBA471
MSEWDSASLEMIASECPAFQARATARAITRYYNICFKPFGLTAEQFALLVGVGANKDATVVQLAMSAGVDATTLSRNVQHLVTRGLIYTEGGRGRSGKRLNLTDAGQALMINVVPVWKAAKQELSQQMGDERLLAVSQAMSELTKAVSSL